MGVSQRVSNEIVKVYTAAGKFSGNLALTVMAGVQTLIPNVTRGYIRKSNELTRGYALALLLSAA
jgi:hypothetical protein